MIEVLLKSYNEGLQREMVVRAWSIAEALRVAKEQGVDGEVRVVFPIDADRFFVRDAAKTTGLEDWEQTMV